MFVVGTAGHVDHGKSALVQALTGIDPDRLEEEKVRGMTIDLGFAWLRLPSGQEVSVVDVPGHERFIKNMLAGVGGIDLALLVVAADEGVMPQTREHLAILDLLQVRRGVVAITKKDLVEQEWLELVGAEVEEVLKGTTLAGAPLVSVSSVTGEGLPELLTTVDAVLAQTPEKKDLGRPRLPIDRVFTISGFGTVVTGTLIDGELKLGQEVEVLPAGLRSRVRGLQTHRHRVEVAVPGSRVAANLAGLSKEDVQRGDVATMPGWLRPTTAVDVKLRLIPSSPSPLRHNATVTFHTGSAEAVAKVRLLEQPELEPGHSTWAQVRLARPVVIAKGDLFILRSSQGTIGGGEAIEPYPKRHRRFHPETLQRLATLERGSPQELLLQHLQRLEPCEQATLVKASGLPQAQAQVAVSSLIAEGKILLLGSGALGATTLVCSATGWATLTRQVCAAVEGYHRQYPLRHGMPKEELKSRLRLSSRATGEALQRLAKEGALLEEGPSVRLPDHRVQFTPTQEAAARDFLAALARDPYSPPGDIMPEPELLNALLEQGKVVRVADNVVFASEAYGEMVRQVTLHLQEHGRITVGEVRDLLRTSRKYALALLEHLDQERITRRVGDERVLR